MVVERFNSFIAWLLGILSPEFIFVLNIIDKADKGLAILGFVMFFATTYYCIDHKEWNFEFDLLQIFDTILSLVPLISTFIPIKPEFYAIFIIFTCVVFVLMLVFGIKEIVDTWWITSLDKTFAWHFLNWIVRALLVLITLSNLIECYMLVV